MPGGADDQRFLVSDGEFDHRARGGVKTEIDDDIARVDMRSGVVADVEGGADREPRVFSGGGDDLAHTTLGAVEKNGKRHG